MDKIVVSFILPEANVLNRITSRVERDICTKERKLAEVTFVD